jgi:hypothetical protein
MSEDISNKAFSMNSPERFPDNKSYLACRICFKLPSRLSISGDFFLTGYLASACFSPSVFSPSSFFF